MFTILLLVHKPNNLAYQCFVKRQDFLKTLKKKIKDKQY